MARLKAYSNNSKKLMTLDAAEFSDIYHKMQPPFQNQYRPLDFVWCLHCEKVFYAKDVKRTMYWRKSERIFVQHFGCPNDGCDGRLEDLFPYKTLREEMATKNHPLVPEIGKIYSQY